MKWKEKLLKFQSVAQTRTNTCSYHVIHRGFKLLHYKITLNSKKLQSSINTKITTAKSRLWISSLRPLTIRNGLGWKEKKCIQYWMWMSLAKCHIEDTGVASWNAATFSMEETDIVREGGWCECLRNVSVRWQSTKPLGSITGNRLIVVSLLAKIHDIYHWIRRFMGTVFQLDSDKEHLLLHSILWAFGLSARTTFCLTCPSAGRYSCNCFILLPQTLKNMATRTHNVVLYFETAHHQFYPRNAPGII